MPKDIWRSHYHGEESPSHHYEHSSYDADDEDHEHNFRHHYGHEDGIDEADLPHGVLTPKTPAKDDPRLKIPQGKSTA